MKNLFPQRLKHWNLCSVGWGEEILDKQLCMCVE